MSKPSLYYVYDPMCSWCWGYRPTWQALEQRLLGLVDVKYVVGGLAPDSNEDMPNDMQVFLQQTWQRIHQQLGTEFNFDFWKKCRPRRSTYPACRAVIVARKQELEKKMYQAIQEAYYLNAQNPSDVSTLADLACSIGINRDYFIEQMQDNMIDKKLMEEFNFARELPINGFPSLVLKHAGKYHSIAINYKDCQETLGQIKTLIG